MLKYAPCVTRTNHDKAGAKEFPTRPSARNGQDGSIQPQRRFRGIAYNKSSERCQ